MVANNATIKGTIKAKSGSIGCDDNGNGGFIIDSNKIYNNKSSLNSNTDGIYIGTDGISLGVNGTFSVDKNGTLAATKGIIAGWNLTETDLYDNNKTNSAGISQNSFCAFWAGNSFDNRDEAPFRVQHDGTVICNKIEANGGNIGKWVITGNGSITNGEDFTDSKEGKSTGMGTYGSDWAFWAGNGRFSVQNNGRLYAENAEIHGKIITNDITATRGTIGGATMTNNSIYTDGWEIYQNGSAVFKNVTIKDNVTITGVQPGSEFGGIYYGTVGGTVGTAAQNLYLNGGFNLDEASKKTFDNLVANKITADYIQSAIADFNYVTAREISTGSFIVNEKETGWHTILYMGWTEGSDIVYKCKAVILGYIEKEEEG